MAIRMHLSLAIAGGGIGFLAAVSRCRFHPIGSTMAPKKSRSVRHNYQSSNLDNTARWVAVDAYAQSHLHPSSRPNSQALSDTIASSASSGLPDYELSAAQAKFLSLHCHAAKVKYALEVGTLGGYTSIWLASQNPDLLVTTLERDEHRVAVARANIARAGLSSRITVIHGDATATLTRLRGEIRSAARPPYNFVFIDADKARSCQYLDLARTMVTSGAVLCFDNVVREGQLADHNDADPAVVASRDLVERVGQEAGIESVVLQTVGEKGYDGWLWVVVKEGLAAPDSVPSL